MKYQKPKRRKKMNVAQYINTKLHVAIFKYVKYFLTKI